MHLLDFVVCLDKIWLTLLQILRDKLNFAKHVLSAFRNSDKAVF